MPLQEGEAAIHAVLKSHQMTLKSIVELGIGNGR